MKPAVAVSVSEIAADYAARGWCVFPVHTPTESGCSCGRRTGSQPGQCRHPGKHPRTLNGFLDATTNGASITDWWRRWPNANIGLATGAVSGLVVLDVDTQKGGPDSLKVLEMRYGTLPATIESITGGGGRHIFFYHPGVAIRDSAGKLGTGLDVRGDGGYVVAPPSLHASGRRYEWEASSHPYEVPLAPLPEWLLRLLLNNNVAMPTNENPTGGAWQLALRTIPEGERNASLTRLAGWLHRYHPLPVVEALLLALNDARCLPPLPPEDVLRIARSIERYPRAGTRGQHRRTWEVVL
ncbi:MAG: bifunctional DNA primase/polymerase [Chloroflexi bacterium]|nr:bifunctional DNA primase/polymerase [Chloroflexota bacterium]